MPPQGERRKTIRRESDCTQCLTYYNQIQRLERDVEHHVATVEGQVTNLHGRIDKTIPRWVFVLTVAAYLSIAGWIAVSTNTININIAKLQTKMVSVERTIEKIKP